MPNPSDNNPEISPEVWQLLRDQGIKIDPEKLRNDVDNVAEEMKDKPHLTGTDVERVQLAADALGALSGITSIDLSVRAKTADDANEDNEEVDDTSIQDLTPEEHEENTARTAKSLRESLGRALVDASSTSAADAANTLNPFLQTPLNDASQRRSRDASEEKKESLSKQTHQDITDLEQKDFPPLSSTKLRNFKYNIGTGAPVNGTVLRKSIADLGFLDNAAAQIAKQVIGLAEASDKQKYIDDFHESLSRLKALNATLVNELGEQPTGYFNIHMQVKELIAADNRSIANSESLQPLIEWSRLVFPELGDDQQEQDAPSNTNGDESALGDPIEYVYTPYDPSSEEEKSPKRLSIDQDKQDEPEENESTGQADEEKLSESINSRFSDFKVIGFTAFKGNLSLDNPDDDELDVIVEIKKEDVGADHLLGHATKRRPSGIPEKKRADAFLALGDLLIEGYGIDNIKMFVAEATRWDSRNPWFGFLILNDEDSEPTVIVETLEWGNGTYCRKSANWKKELQTTRSEISRMGAKNRPHAKGFNPADHVAKMQEMINDVMADAK